MKCFGKAADAIYKSLRFELISNIESSSYNLFFEFDE